MGEKLILNAVLNFISRALNDGIKMESIIKPALGYYDHETIILAKRILHTELNEPNRVVIRSKDEDNILEMSKTLVNAAKQKVNIPKFVIFSPCEVPAIGDAVSATANSKINEMSRKLNGALATLTHPQMSLPKPSQQSLNCAPPSKLSHAVMVKNPPTDLKGPNERKVFLDSMCQNSVEDVTELKCTKNEWKLVVRTKTAATKLVETMKTSSPSLNASLKESAYIGVVKRVLEDIDHSKLKELIPKCTKVTQCGKSRTYKVYFQTRSDLEVFLENLVRIGYERLQAQEFVFLPRRCFNCHRIGHIASNCENPSTCSKCGSHEHISTREAPCSKLPFCVECKVPGHTCYSISCPKNRQLQKS